MHRRLILAIGLVAVLAGLAGCADTTGSISMQPVDDESLAESASRPLPDADTAPDATTGDVARRAIENGSASTVALGPPVEPGLPFRHDGRFYNLTYTVDGTEPGNRARVQIDYNASSVDGDVVEYRDLPAVDRQTLETLLQGPRRSQGPGYDFGIGVVYGQVETDTSVLLTEQEYDAVRYQGEVYPINVNHTESVTLSNYEYEATPVADSPDDYAAHVSDRYEFGLSGLSEAEQNVVDEALNSTYYPEGDDDDGFESLVDRFRSHDAVDGNEYGGSWIVRYDGQRYLVDIEFGPYREAGDAGTQPEETPPPGE